MFPLLLGLQAVQLIEAKEWLRRSRTNECHHKEGPYDFSARSLSPTRTSPRPLRHCRSDLAIAVSRGPTGADAQSCDEGPVVAR